MANQWSPHAPSMATVDERLDSLLDQLTESERRSLIETNWVPGKGSLVWEHRKDNTISVSLQLPFRAEG